MDATTILNTDFTAILKHLISVSQSYQVSSTKTAWFYNNPLFLLLDMNLDSKIYIAGHRGLAGSAIIEALKNNGYQNLVTRNHADLELTDPASVIEFFSDEKPEIVILSAAKVGGIHANDTYPADFIYQNLQIQNNVIHQSKLFKIKKLLFLGSSCIYPKYAPQPLKEEYLLSDKLEPTNQAYAIAKIAGIEMCRSYRRQYGCNFICAMPTIFMVSMIIFIWRIVMFCLP